MKIVKLLEMLNYWGIFIYIYLWIISLLSSITIDVEGIIFCLLMVKSCAFCLLYLWFYLWSNNPMFNVFNIYTQMYVWFLTKYYTIVLKSILLTCHISTDEFIKHLLRSSNNT